MSAPPSTFESAPDGSSNSETRSESGPGAAPARRPLPAARDSRAVRAAQAAEAAAAVHTPDAAESAAQALRKPGVEVEEQHYRSVLKAISWRVTGTVDTMVISYLVTGNLKVAASIGFLEVFTKMALYYTHERVWGKLKFGRVVKEVPPPDYQI